MKTLEPIFNSSVVPGIFRYASRAQPDSVLAAVAEHGWTGVHIDGQKATDKATFLNQFAQALSFPDYFGKNWDAFEDCLRDLMWLPAPGYVLLYDHVSDFASTNPQEWETARSILTDTTRYWQKKEKPMYVLLRQSGRTAMDLSWV